MKKIHRFITPYSIENNQIIINEESLVHQIKNVLKLKKGEEIILAHKDTGETVALIEKIDSKNVICNVEKNSQAKKPKKEVALYTAILKNENFEFVVQKASEIGITKIIPIITERTIKTGIKYERVIKIATEASELSGRIDVPEIHNPISLTEAIHESSHYDKRILFDKSGTQWHKQPDSSIALFIGPEGGFTEKEMVQAKESGCEIISLGETILRGETANIIASYLATH